MRKFSVLSAFMAVGLISAPLLAQAQERSGLYMGASVGEATNEVGEFKGSDTAFKLLAGFSFNEYLGVELAYVDAGRQEDIIGSVEIDNESDGVIASTLFRLPLGKKAAVFAKLGYAFYDSEATARLGNLRESENDSGDYIAYGIGVEIVVWRGLSLRAEYEAVDVDAGDFEIVSAGVAYKF